MTTMPIGFHSKRHDADDAQHRDTGCAAGKMILALCSCHWEPLIGCGVCFKHEATTNWRLVKEILSAIEKLLHRYPDELPFPLPPKDLGVKTFIKSMNAVTGWYKEGITAQLRRCEKAGLVEIEHHQDDYNPRVKSLTSRGQKLLSALEESNIERFVGWELEDPWGGLHG